MVTGYDRTYGAGEWGGARDCLRWWWGTCFVVGAVMCIMAGLVNGTWPGIHAWRGSMPSVLEWRNR